MNFTADEAEVIARLSVVGGWDDGDAKALKSKIKSYLLLKALHCCCYCRRSMQQWHGLTIDVEHVLPKRKFPKYTFELRNLNVSCKRCNMGIKLEDTSFYLGSSIEGNPFQSALYRFVHSNLDSVSQHLRIVFVQLDTKLLVKYLIPGDSAKGAETYRFFKLKDIETNSFDEAQGLSTALPSESLPREIARELQAVLQELE
jgi:hypothetical protein